MKFKNCVNLCLLQVLVLLDCVNVMLVVLIFSFLAGFQYSPINFIAISCTYFVHCRPRSPSGLQAFFTFEFAILSSRGCMTDKW